MYVCIADESVHQLRIPNIVSFILIYQLKRIEKEIIKIYNEFEIESTQQ